MLLPRIKARLAAFARCEFARNEDGVVAIEAMIVLPVMFWAFLSMFSIFDSFRAYSINQKAAFTIGDAISRETQPIDSAYLTGSQQLFEYLSGSQGRSNIRVSSLRFNGNANQFELDWSQSRGWLGNLSSSDVRDWQDRLPIMPHNERIILVETWAEYDPPFATGLEEREIRNFVFTRPRYAPRVCWNQCN